MTRLLVLIGLTWLFCLVSVSAQDLITETDVVTILNGKPRLSAPGHLVGITLHLLVSPVTASGEEGKRAPNDLHRPADDLLYKTLIPLARALEAGVSMGSRYIIRLSPDPSLPPVQAARWGQHVRDTVVQFLTAYFTIPPERLNLQLNLPSTTIGGRQPPQSTPQRWRMDVLRQD